MLVEDDALIVPRLPLCVDGRAIPAGGCRVVTSISSFWDLLGSGLALLSLDLPTHGFFADFAYLRRSRLSSRIKPKPWLVHVPRLAFAAFPVEFGATKKFEVGESATTFPSFGR